jgi:ArsR family transcriptional regulator
MRIEAAVSGSASDRVFEGAADLFSLLSTPTRLRIVCELRESERNVSDLLERIGVSQPNISQHLGLLYRGGVVARRRAGAQVFYRIVSDSARHLCDAICRQPQPPPAPGSAAAERDVRRDMKE